MNKKQLIESVAAEHELSIAEAKRTIESFLNTIVSEVAKGTKVSIAGLGIFSNVERKARKGINPSTGESIQIAAKNAPKFKAAKPFKDALNK